ncbi:MAG TPA: transglycosylase SLT domain-containing protein [Candidatus Acidoferrales bacterium]|nr:transglycosylase SLT domain-containing protein [Candidatus Acidoferrales bacterium]
MATAVARRSAHVVAIGIVLLILHVQPLIQVGATMANVQPAPIIPAITLHIPLPAPTPSATPPPVKAVSQRSAVHPAATPAPAVPTSAQGVAGIIQAAFASQGSTAVAWALRVARCESGYNPNATNVSSGAAGLFQFEPATWSHTPWASSSVYSPVPNAQAAAWLYRQDHGAAWSCK